MVAKVTTHDVCFILTPSRLLNMHGFGSSSKKINYKLDIDLKVINTNDVVV